MMDVFVVKVRQDQMQEARASLGSPAALDEAIVSTGIDAFLYLLNGGTVEIEGQQFALKVVRRCDEA